MPGGQINEAETRITGSAELPEQGSDEEVNRGIKASLEQCLKDMAPLKRKPLGDGGAGKGKKPKTTDAVKGEKPNTEVGPSCKHVSLLNFQVDKEKKEKQDMNKNIRSSASQPVISDKLPLCATLFDGLGFGAWLAKAVRF